MTKHQHDQLDAFVLHTRPYRESSLLVEFFSKDLGRFTAVARHKRNKHGGHHLYQMFSPLKITVYGRGDLLTVKNAEPNGLPYFLNGQAQVCGLYVHELLMYTTVRFDPHPEIFLAYQHCMYALSQQPLPQKSLRVFELQLLEALGYGINFDVAGNMNAAIDEEAHYYFEDHRGFALIHPEKIMGNELRCFSGRLIKKIAILELTEAEDFQAAKRLTRLALTPILNGREIKSRALLK